MTKPSRIIGWIGDSPIVLTRKGDQNLTVHLDNSDPQIGYSIWWSGHDRVNTNINQMDYTGNCYEYDTVTEAVKAVATQVRSDAEARAERERRERKRQEERTIMLELRNREAADLFNGHDLPRTGNLDWIFDATPEERS